jgi:DNA repair exonuclease SbcCD nuclease subunit
MDALTPIIGALGIENIKYFTKSELVEDENVIWSIYSIFDNHAKPEELNFRTFKDKKVIGLYHGVVAGAVNEMGFVFTNGADVEKFSDCNIVLCGDIHKRQILKTKSGVDIIFPGSLIQQNFGETVSQHGYGVLNIGDGGFNYNFYDIDNPVKYLTFKITDFSEIEEGCELFTNA